MNNNANSQGNQVHLRTDVLTVKKKVDKGTNKFRSMPVFHRRAEALPCKTDTEPTTVMPESPLQPKGCTRDSDNTPHQTARLTDPQKFPQGTPYAVLPSAFYEIKTGTQQIKVRLQQKDSPHAIRQDETNFYIICSNMY